MKKIIIFLLASLLLIGCGKVVQEEQSKNTISQKSLENITLENAYFAGGCFWCMEGIFEGQTGVSEAISGYLGGSAETATYNQVSAGKTGHREGVKVIYNPELISYSTLVELYWTQVDPTDSEGQFADRGFHYTTAIYYSNDEEKTVADASKKTLADSQKFDKAIVTNILPVVPFYDAEEYHQDYAKKQTLQYKAYEKGSGRADFKEDVWKEESERLEKSPHSVSPKGREEAAVGDIDKQELKSRLTPLQYKVTQEGGTETPFDNPYWDNKKEGIYVDITDGTPLYSSIDKYKSGTGWPSFTKPIDTINIEEREDNTLFSKRIEIVGAKSGAHIGHVFTDGPTDKGGLRYCMNSAAMKFIPTSDLETEGYGEYVELFE